MISNRGNISGNFTGVRLVVKRVFFFLVSGSDLYLENTLALTNGSIGTWLESRNELREDDWLKIEEAKRTRMVYMHNSYQGSV